MQKQPQQLNKVTEKTDLFQKTKKTGRVASTVKKEDIAEKLKQLRGFAGIGYRNDGTQTLEALEKRRLEFRGND